MSTDPDTNPAGRRINSWIDRIPGLRWVWFNLGPGLLVSVIVLFLVGLAGEGWIRLRVRHNAKASPPVSANKAATANASAAPIESPKQSEPFQKIIWPGTWNPEATFTFLPHAEIQWTNHLDFWVRQRSNAVGFADRDWDEAKPPGVIRIAFIGDSFVEALQVPIEDKSHVIFEAKANRALAPKKFETAAFGMSGTGQVNQLSFYDAVARKFRPDLVVLVVVNNDFANNSAILEGVRNGWHPEHMPRLFYIRRGLSDPFHRAPLDGNYKKHYLSSEGPTPTPGLRAALDSKLRKRSLFYTWFAESFKLRFPSLAAKAAHRPTQDEIYSARIAAIRKLPGYEHSLDGWNFPDDWDCDSMFAAQRIAPVFSEAIAATGFALDEFQRRANEDGFRLVLLMTSNLSENIGNAAVEKSTGNPGLERGRFTRFKDLADARGIPIVDMLEYLDRHKIELGSLTWAHDGHWNQAGHDAAAGALLEAIQSHPEWLSP
jgi:hypothetical protein